MAGRTLYWPKDAAWWRRGRIVKLGREFGPAGPAVIDHLMCDARTQGPIKGHDGSVRSDFASLSMLCFVGDDALVAKIVARATELGVLDDFEDFGDGMFECRMSGWLQDVERPLARSQGRLAALVRRERLGGRRISPEQRAARSAMWGDRCWLCGVEATAMDHVKPVAKGGLHVPANLRPICKPCNSRKGAQWPFGGLV